MDMQLCRITASQEHRLNIVTCPLRRLCMVSTW